MRQSNLRNLYGVWLSVAGGEKSCRSAGSKCSALPEGMTGSGGAGSNDGAIAIWLTERRVMRSGARTTYSYDAANQLRYSQLGSARTTYVYDSTGNQQIEQPAVGNRTTTTWTYENPPTLYQLASGIRVTMSYNGDNRRVQIQEP